MSRKPEMREERPRRRLSHRTVERSNPQLDYARLMSSHPEIEEEICAVGGGLDESRVYADEKHPSVKPIVSIDGCDVENAPRHKNDRAA